ncbi:MAG: hypothetical protein WC010_04035 [Candidatus Absconditabacterales bacterium]
MKKKILISIIFIVGIMFLGSKSEAYLFGMKSFDNSIENIQKIEKEYKLDIPIVSFIFDPRGPHVETMMNKLNEELGADKIYHISISPNMLSAKEVYEGKFDEQYIQFFQDVKKNNLRVIFRTMHEMNGGRYPRSSDPYRFKKAWIHVRELSRAEGLSRSNILFDMSVNARDLPAKGGIPAQTATFIQCTQSVKAKLKCPTFEDYYPGDKYVDLMGVTFYNRGKGNSNRRRGTPDMIVNNGSRKTLDRLKKFPKPIFVDEVGTTAVNYTGAYDFNASREVYESNKDMKNERLLQLREFLLRENRVVGAIYFNVDLTNGLRSWTLGELDRSVIDFVSNKFYDKILDIYEAGSSNHSKALYYLFNAQRLTLNERTHLVKSNYVKPVKDLYADIQQYSTSKKMQLNQLDEIKAKNSLANKYRRFSKDDLDGIINATISFLE